MISRSRIGGGILLAVLSLPDPVALRAQEPTPPPPPKPSAQGEASAVQEAGGRLVVRGETVVVSASPDRPVSESSVGTKIETPLIETPRSITVVDRRMLDDLGVINMTQAHEYAVGMTLLDERGPAFARAFPVGF